MKRTIPIASALLFVIWAGYISSQQPKVGFNRQRWDFMLLKGGYRSWTMWLCDGEIPEWNGSLWVLKPVVFTNGGGYRMGYYHWPRYSHSDYRKLTVGTNTIATLVFSGDLTVTTNSLPLNKQSNGQ